MKSTGATQPNHTTVDPEVDKSKAVKSAPARLLLIVVLFAIGGVVKVLTAPTPIHERVDLTPTVSTFEIDEASASIAGDLVAPNTDTDVPSSSGDWFAADKDNVFVVGLDAERIEAETGLTLGSIVEETGGQLAGPTITFGSGSGAVQLDTRMFTFEDIVAANPQASIETMSGYDVVVLGGLGAVIDFPEGPVTVSSYDFSLPDSGVQLARLIADARSAT